MDRLDGSLFGWCIYVLSPCKDGGLSGFSAFVSNDVCLYPLR